MPALDIEGANLAYEELGGGSPAALLIHGTGGALWGELPAQLAEQRRTIWYHRRSFGASTHEPIKDPPRHTADAAALLERRDAAPAIVVGWSMGGVIALHLAITRPELVKALVLVEPPLHLKKHPDLNMMRKLIAAQVVRRVKGPRAATERFLHFSTEYSDGGDGFDEVPADAREAILANAGAIMRELDAGTGEHVREDEIARIACPVVCLVGARTMPMYANATHRIGRALPAARIQPISGAGHTLPLTHSAAVAEAVQSVAQAAAAA
jgi:pimeloyl-ACP methyl ester carboxylesterase